MLAHALEHAARGWRVLPVNGKIPMVKGWQHVATADTAQIAEWWKRWPKANVGLLCGVEFWALDVDPASGGRDALDDLEARHGKLPHTVESVTGRLGAHLFFNDAEVGTGTIVPGLDFRGVGGFIVAPGSIHPVTCRRYEWELLGHPDDVPIASAPAWLLDLVRPRRAKVLGPPIGPVASSFLADAWREAGWKIGGSIDGIKLAVRCPNLAAHSDGRGDGRDASTVILPATSATPCGAFKCSHGHCAHISTEYLITQLLPEAAGNVALAAHPHLKSTIVRMFERSFRKVG